MSIKYCQWLCGLQMLFIVLINTKMHMLMYLLHINKISTWNMRINLSQISSLGVRSDQGKELETWAKFPGQTEWNEIGWWHCKSWNRWRTHLRQHRLTHWQHYKMSLMLIISCWLILVICYSVSDYCTYCTCSIASLMLLCVTHECLL